MLVLGAVSFAAALYHVTAPAETKAFYVLTILFALFGVVALSKSIRDRVEHIPVNPVFYGLSYVAVLAPATFLAAILYYCDYAADTKWLIFASATLMAFAAASIQKNIRDVAVFTGLQTMTPPKP